MPRPWRDLSDSVPQLNLSQDNCPNPDIYLMARAEEFAEIPGFCYLERDNNISEIPVCFPGRNEKFSQELAMLTL